MRKNLLLIAAFLMTFGLVNAQYKVLLVDDDANGSDESFRIDTALAHSGYTYSFINIDTNATPSYDDLKDYDMVIWTTSNDGVNLNLWDVSDTAGIGAGAVKFNSALMQYVDSGNVVWVDGLDFIYDIYGSAPDDFNVGDFCYDVMGIDNYVAQSHGDDTLGSYNGLEVALKASTNTITTLDSMKWKYSSVWWADAFDATSTSTVLYEMGPADYDFAGKASMLYNQNVITSSLRIGALGDGANYDQAEIDLLVKDMVDAAVAGTFVKTGIGMEENYNNASFVSYPNPASSMITFEMPATKTASLVIYDITGKVIFNQNINATSGIYNLDLSSYQSGMYIYNILSGNESSTGKFSVVK